MVPIESLEWYAPRQVMQELFGTNDESVLCPHCKMEPETILHCLVRCKGVIVDQKELAIAIAKELRELGVSPKYTVKIWFDNIQFARHRIKKMEERKTSRGYLITMMGIENGAVKKSWNQVAYR